MFNKLSLAAASVAMMSSAAFAADKFETVPSTPDWKVTVGAIYLKRQDGGGDHPLFYDGTAGTPGSTVYADDGDLDDSGTFGIEAALDGELIGRHAELRGIWAMPDETSWSDPTAQAVAFPGFSLGTADPAGFGLFGGNGLFALSAKRETTFASLEGNIELARIGTAEAFVGVRGFWIDDDLSLLADSTPSNFGPGFTTTGDIDVSNRLYGPQIGIRGRFDNLSSSAFSLEGFLKAGLMNNHSDVSIAGGGTIGGPTSGSDSHSETYWTGMFEAGLTGNIAVTSNMNIEIGYQVLYFNDLGTSPASLNNSTLNTGSGPITADVGKDSVLFHAASVKAVWTF
ncbi:MAG: BBP7 family outer membrane beta-barrel protein [Nitratireductor sp.]|nr:BBP7 family outer membrane beta-barrel protein [Nitratireductor sp.]